jgi:hypothetical protein
MKYSFFPVTIRINHILSHFTATERSCGFLGAARAPAPVQHQHNYHQNGHASKTPLIMNS